MSNPMRDMIQALSKRLETAEGHVSMDVDLAQHLLGLVNHPWNPSIWRHEKTVTLRFDSVEEARDAAKILITLPRKK